MGGGGGLVLAVPSQTNLNALIDFQPTGMKTLSTFKGPILWPVIWKSKNPQKQWLGLAASFIISIYLSPAHGVMTQLTGLVLSISLCLLFVLLLFFNFWIFTTSGMCDFLCFCHYTQAKVQSNVLKEIILLNFGMTSSFLNLIHF